jgi:hypothetical protein
MITCKSIVLRRETGAMDLRPDVQFLEDTVAK